jgi:hypothetical protein
VSLCVFVRRFISLYNKIARAEFRGVNVPFKYMRSLAYVRSSGNKDAIEQLSLYNKQKCIKNALKTRLKV